MFDLWVYIPFSQYFIIGWYEQLQFVKVIYHQIKNGFKKSRDHNSGGGIGTNLFLDEGWFSKDIFLYRLCKVFKFWHFDSKF